MDAILHHWRFAAPLMRCVRHKRRAHSPGIITRMIETLLSPTLAATVLHRVSGIIDQQQAEQGATDALRFVQQLSGEHRVRRE